MNEFISRLTKIKIIYNQKVPLKKSTKSKTRKKVNSVKVPLQPSKVQIRRQKIC